MRIFAVGETTYDILFRNSQPVSACSGGSAYNSAISLGRCGLPVSLVSTFGKDKIGDLSMSFLKANRVNCDLIKRFDGRSRVALAFFDSNENADYSFYPASEDIFPSYPIPHRNDVILLGSSFAIRDYGRDELLRFLKEAQQVGCTVIYDPNARQCVTHKPEILRKIFENIALASIVKGSDQDFRNIFGTETAKNALLKICESGDRILVYTKGAAGSELLTAEMHLEIPARKTLVVSTIGAGDNFSAGLVYGLCQKLSANQKIEVLTSNHWEEIMNYGTHFASAVCGSSDNYIPEEDAKLLRSDNVRNE